MPCALLNKAGIILTSRRGPSGISAVPTHIQDVLFCWESEFFMCDRVSRIGMALDTVTDVYISVLGHFTRTADVRYRLLEATSENLVVPAYYCDRMLDSTLHAISAQRKKINTLMGKIEVELRNCTELRRSTERSCLEVQRDMAGNDTVITRWRNRYVRGLHNLFLNF